MGGHLVQRGGAWADCCPAQSPLAVPNVTAHPLTASVPITVLLYDGLLLCSFNVAIRVNKKYVILKTAQINVTIQYTYASHWCQDSNKYLTRLLNEWVTTNAKKYLLSITSLSQTATYYSAVWALYVHMLLVQLACQMINSVHQKNVKAILYSTPLLDNNWS